MKKLRVGILVRDGYQPFLVHDFFQRSLLSTRYSVDVLIVQSKSDSNSEGFFERIFSFYKRRGFGLSLRRALFEVIDQLESFFVKRSDKFRVFFETHSLDSFNVPLLRVEPLVSKSGLVYRFTSSDIARIRSLNLDVIVLGGSGILRGDILSSARFGVLSFHHADNHVNRGGPPGFWEVFYRQPVTGFILQLLSNELDGGDVLFKGSVPTSILYKINQCQLFIKSSFVLHKTLEKLSAGTVKDLTLPKSPYAYPLYTLPTLWQGFSYLVSSFFLLAKKVLGKLLGWQYRWSVAYQFNERWDSAVLWRSRVVLNPPHRFFADPFVISHEGIRVIFVEDYDFRTRRGSISALEVMADGYRELGVVLQEDCHLSYPFVFEVDGDVYMIPETHELCEIRLYKCVDFPKKWEFHKTLISGFRAVDSSIFHFQGRWWLFTNADSSGLDEFGSELHIFSADTFDSAIWLAHADNPVVFDASRARNGGFFVSNSGFYRFFQKRAFDLYGAGVGCAKIVDLSLDSYIEDVVFDIPPCFIDDICGVHTFSFSDGLLAIDVLKYGPVKN